MCIRDSGSIDQVRRNTSAGRSAHLYGFELSVVLDAAADVVKNLSEDHTHRYFHKSAFFDLAGQSKYFGALALLGSHGAESSAAVVYDPRYVGKCFNVVDVSRLRCV